MKRQILILAKSYKKGEYCIAGIDLNNYEWVRPVSNNLALERAVPVEDITYENGEELQVLDIVNIEFVEPKNTEAQRENILYDEQYYWEKVGEFSYENFINLVFANIDSPDYIFVNNEKSLERDELTGESLLLAKIDNPQIFIKTFEGNKKIKINFYYNNIEYRYISIGDPELLKKYSDYCDGTYHLGTSRYAVFSLTNAYSLNGKYYKMLAKLF